MAMSSAEKAIRKIIKETTDGMKAIGTYKVQFNPTIRAYAEMRYQYNLLMAQFFESDCQVTEEYTNKAGFTNIRKTATYLALETIRKDILSHENLLGLTPAGYRRITNASANSKEKRSKLAEALNELR